MKNFRLEPKVRVWEKRLRDAGCRIDDLTPLHLVPNSKGELLFGLFRAQVRDHENEALMPIVLIRGDACVIVPLVRNRKTGEERFVMVVQRRIGSGHASVEFPAGMVDREIADPRSVIINELAEETGLMVKPNDVFLLSNRPLFSSPGLQDEAIYYFGCILDLPEHQYLSLDGKRTGNSVEGERIRVTLKTAEEGKCEATSAQVLLGFYLFEEWRKTAQPNFRSVASNRAIYDKASSA